jgi:hypothetical protein
MKEKEMSIIQMWKRSSSIAIPACAVSILVTFTFSLAFSQQQPSGRTDGILEASATPPEEIAALEREIGQKIPRPPARASVGELFDGISRQPGQVQKVEAAKGGERPGKVQTRATFTLTTYSEQTQPFSITLSPQVADLKVGAHSGLRLSDGSAYAYLLGGLVYWDFPNSGSVRLYRGSLYSHNTTNPLVYFYVKVPTEGWYTINMNASTRANVQLMRSGMLLEDLPMVSGWNDYSSLQYLQAGGHYLQFVMPAGGYVSRITVDCYKC